MRRVLITSIAALVICAIATQEAQAEVVFNETVTWTQLITNNSCLPEETVMATGQMHILETVTIDKDGKEHWTLLRRPVNIQLFSVEWVPDWTTEDPDDGEYVPVGDPWPYRAVGMTRWSNTVDYDPLDVIEVYQNNFLLVGKGDLPDYKVHVNGALMVELDEEGNLVLDYKVINIKVTCN